MRLTFNDNFIAFIDVMGFSELVKHGDTDRLEEYFNTVTEILPRIQDGKPGLAYYLISDSIILISPGNLTGLKQLITAIRRIQSALLWKKILIRGAISHGQVFHDAAKNLIVGKGFIRAYLLEKEATYPRVIIDPAIVKLMADDRVDFLKKINKGDYLNFSKRLVYSRRPDTIFNDDSLFVDYASRLVINNRLDGKVKPLYDLIHDNLYSDQKLYSKYIWLKEYCLETLQDISLLHRNDADFQQNIQEEVTRFARL